MFDHNNPEYDNNAVCNDCGHEFHQIEQFELEYCPECESGEVQYL